MRRALLLMVLATVVAACGGGEVSSSARTVSTTTTTTTTTIPQSELEIGASGVGDPYYPALGNGGYDVEHYDIDLDWRPGSAVPLRATATITLRPTVHLDRFNLDLKGLEVTEVLVGGEVAPFTREGRELVIDPVAPLPRDSDQTVVVSYRGAPTPISAATKVFDLGWHRDGTDVWVSSEPAGAATWFPGNDHPSDKATFSIAITVPEGLVAAATGRLVSTDTTAGRTTFSFDSADLTATYLVSVVVGDFEVTTSTSDSGVEIRNVVDRNLVEQAATSLAPTAEILAIFEDWFGPYPFELYGHAVIDQELGFALENQTLTLFGSDLIGAGERLRTIVAHELAHSWFGNAVSPATWRDIWLNEGFTTYAEWIASEELGDKTRDEIAATVHDRFNLDILLVDPGKDELFDLAVYFRGALTLHALSKEMGEEAFRELLRTWFERYDDASASTADFEALAAEIAGRDLSSVFDPWLRSTAVPPLPT